MLSTVARTGSVLNMFTTDKPEWGVREAAEHLGLPKSNTHELMASMSRIGLLRRTPSGRYRLGWRLLTISADLLGGSGFEAHAHQVADDYAARLGETVTVGAWDGLHVVCVASRPGRRTRSAVAAGDILPGHATALGKLLMSSLPWEMTMSIIDRYGLPRYTAATVADASSFESQLEAARRTGLAHEYGEYAQGLACVATGVHDCGDLVAAVSVTASVERMQVRREEYTAAIRGAARALLRPNAR